MKETTKLVFDRPQHIPSSLDGIEVIYPYKITRICEEQYKLPREDIFLGRYKALISGTLAMGWGFQIWQPSEKYEDLIKLLFMYVVKDIRTKYAEGTLNEFEELMLLTSNNESDPVYDINQIPDIEGHEEILLKEVEEVKSISKKINENQLAGDIINYRDLINAMFYKNHSKKLLELDQERNLLDFFKQAESKEEFSYRIASIGSLVGLMNKNLLKALTPNITENFGTIKLLEVYIDSLEGDLSETTEVLKQLNRLRQGYPIHTDKANGVLEAYQFFGIDYPVTDFSSAWQIILSNYLNFLKSSFEIFKIELLKKE